MTEHEPEHPVQGPLTRAETEARAIADRAARKAAAEAERAAKDEAQRARDEETRRATAAEHAARVEEIRKARAEWTSSTPPPADAEEPWQTQDELRARVADRTWRTSLEAADYLALADLTLADLDAYQQPKLLERFVGALGTATGKRTMVLSGNVGAGKTVAAVAAGTHGASLGLLARFVSHGVYLSMLRPDGSEVADYRIRDLYGKCDLLILDDLGATQEVDKEARPFVVEETIKLIDRRVNAGRGTIITTNLTDEQIEKMFTSRVISRLSRKAAAIDLVHEDRRGRIKFGRKPV